MQPVIGNSWSGILKPEWEKPYFRELQEFVSAEYRDHSCYPPQEQIFAAFAHCPFEEVRVVILGQDPYHGPGQANGLAFSVADGISKPPSLQNIFREIHQDIGLEIPQSGNLERWAEQGVLLLNTTLTVRQGQAGSHQGKGWESFTDAVIRKLSAEREHLVFLLWGNHARQKGKAIAATRHLILESGHPSPMSANRGLWFGNGHFSKANAYLSAQGGSPIAW